MRRWLIGLLLLLGALPAFAQQSVPTIAFDSVSNPLRLPEHLDGCDRLVILDACRSGAEPGSIVRLKWPDDRLSISAGHSTHGFGVGAALAIAEALGRLPTRVILFGIEAGPCEPGAGLSTNVRAALPELYRRVLKEILEAESGEDCHE